MKKETSNSSIKLINIKFPTTKKQNRNTHTAVYLNLNFIFIIEIA